LKHILDGKRVTITGGTGSLGTQLVIRLLTGNDGNPHSVTVFSRDELKQANMKATYKDDRLRFVIGDMRDADSVWSVLQYTDILFNAAALKRVETCEKFPDEAIATNYIGASNIVKAIRQYKCPVEAVVNVGSDKNCSPINVYGASKFLQECRLMVANSECPNTRFVGVRYGNVMASRGSVIPIWQEQIQQGKPVTVTDPAMTRFLISLDQAVDTLLDALKFALPGEVYIPQLPASRIGDMAEALLDGKCNEIKITGKGHGEKMHEVLITDQEAERTIERDNYYVITSTNHPRPVLDREYISKDHLISKAELRQLFVKNGFITERAKVVNTWDEQ
jgi:FlaA1/EpsC-like NDP-sugar epimerase